MTGTDLFARDCFPQQSVSFSPDKRHSILWSEPKNGGSHHLAITGERGKRNLFEFERQACVSWEPTGSHFALTDYMGSNVSEAYVYSSSDGTKVFDVLSIIPAAIRALYAENHHSYIEVLSWTKAGILVHLWGYGDQTPKGFDKTLRCSKKDEEWHCKKEPLTRRSNGS